MIKDCENCGQQNAGVVSGDETCLFCGKPLKKVLDTDAIAPPTPPAETDSAIISPLPKAYSKRAAYFEKHKAQILECFRKEKLKDFFRLWHMNSARWTNLKRKWGLLDKEPEKQEQKTTPYITLVVSPQPTLESDRERLLYLAGWQACAREIIGGRK